MSDVPPPDSLILGNGQQLALLEADDAGLPAAAYEPNERAGKFTGARIFAGNPKLYAAIVKLLARAVPYREISEICGVSVNTVCAIAAREQIPIETLRERIGRLGLDVAALSIEAVRDLLADPEWRAKQSLKDLMIAHGISFDKAQLGLGGATSRIETVSAAPTHEDYLALIRNVTEVPATGLGSGTRGQKEAVEAAPADLVPSPETPAN